ncbi:MAG: rhomboid family intramembrane serine protease [Dorea sp.]|jgi:rhomboid protease GluP|nr:rhomboid family intramembrane serine protease [Dorea sp.]GFI43057.1 rhomboid protease GluP [Lachnospiraceae bacterium]
MKKNKVSAPCTILLAAINVIVFFILTSQGMTEDGLFLLEHGAMYVPRIMEDEEYYRLFSSMFLHFGFEHLMNNMVTLVLLGWNLEIEIGKFKFLVIYILSGLGGNFLSAWYEVWTADYSISAGASGAIFGVIGALLYVAMRNRGRIGDISGRGIVFMIILSLYYGFTSSGVDNLAHIGGLITGFVLGILLYWKRNGKGGTNSQG